MKIAQTLLLVAAAAFAFACKSSTDHQSENHEEAKSAVTTAATQPGSRPGSKPVPKAFESKPAAGTVAVCAVSSEVFTVEEKTDIAEHDGKFYAFCCDGCIDKFKADPAKYASN